MGFGITSSRFDFQLCFLHRGSFNKTFNYQTHNFLICKVGIKISILLGLLKDLELTHINPLLRIQHTSGSPPMKTINMMIVMMIITQLRKTNILISNTLHSLPHLLCEERHVLENKSCLFSPVGERSDCPSHCHMIS